MLRCYYRLFSGHSLEGECVLTCLFRSWGHPGQRWVRRCWHRHKKVELMRLHLKLAVNRQPGFRQKAVEQSEFPAWGFRWRTRLFSFSPCVVLRPVSSSPFSSLGLFFSLILFFSFFAWCLFCFWFIFCLFVCFLAVSLWHATCVFYAFIHTIVIKN